MNLLTLLTGIDAQVCLDVLGAARNLPFFGTALGGSSQEEETSDTCSYARELRRHAASEGSDLPEESQIQTILGRAESARTVLTQPDMYSSPFWTSLSSRIIASMK